MDVGSFLLSHPFELRLLVAILAIAGGFALIELYTFIVTARDAVLEKYRKTAVAKDAATGITPIRRAALGSQ